MAVISFPFKSALALRIANLITNDIEKLEREAFGTVTNWQSKYERPFKAHYANDLVARALNIDRAAFALANGIGKYEKRAEAYANNPNKKGRPLTSFINVDDPTADNAVEEQMESEDNGLADEIAAILSDNIPVPQSRQSSPRASATAAQPQNLPKQPTTQAAPVKLPDGIPADAQNALAALMAALTPQAAPIDETMIREIARDEAKKTISPTIVIVNHVDPDGEITVVDMGVQHKAFPMLLKLCQLKDHAGYAFPIWLPGPAGSGKTTAAMNVAKALDISFHHTGAVDTDYKLTGYQDGGGLYHSTEFRAAYENGGVFLFDEVDASNPNAMVALNAAIENGRCAFPDATIARHKDCVVIAAANTYGGGATHEYVGRNKLDAATVDRFIMLDWPYDEILERAIAGDNEWTTYVQSIRRAVNSAGIKHVVSPRASIRGNAMLAAGFDRPTVIKATVQKGLSAEQWASVSMRA
jgi:hypothetical protein